VLYITAVILVDYQRKHKHSDKAYRSAQEKYADKHLNRRQLLHTDMAEADMIFQLHSLVFEKSL
jgi:hypothetical protein